MSGWASATSEYSGSDLPAKRLHDKSCHCHVGFWRCVGTQALHNITLPSIVEYGPKSRQHKAQNPAATAQPNTTNQRLEAGLHQACAWPVHYVSRLARLWNVGKVVQEPEKAVPDSLTQFFTMTPPHCWDCLRSNCRSECFKAKLKLHPACAVCGQVQL